MKRRRGLVRAAPVLLVGLLACGGADRSPAAGGSASLPAPPRLGFAARGIRYGFTTESGKRREIEVDAVGTLPGRISGLRVPLLDGLVLEGVRVVEDGAVVKSISRLAIDPFAAAVRWRRGAEWPPEVIALAEALANVVSRRPGAKPPVSPRSNPTAGSAGRRRSSASPGQRSSRRRRP
jgi:hypothetical protein